MSAPDALRPPEGVVTARISSAARLVERLKIRRRVLLKQLRRIDDEISVAGRALRDIVRDATVPPPAGQYTLDDADLAALRDEGPEAAP